MTNEPEPTRVYAASTFGGVPVYVETITQPPRDPASMRDMAPVMLLSGASWAWFGFALYVFVTVPYNNPFSVLLALAYMGVGYNVGHNISYYQLCNLYVKTNTHTIVKEPELFRIPVSELPVEHLQVNTRTGTKHVPAKRQTLYWYDSTRSDFEEIGEELQVTLLQRIRENNGQITRGVMSPMGKDRYADFCRVLISGGYLERRGANHTYLTVKAREALSTS